MVSKRRSMTEKEAGPSKKRAKAEEKPAKTKSKEQNNTVTTPEVKQRKTKKNSKVTKESPAKDENIDLSKVKEEIPAESSEPSEPAEKVENNKKVAQLNTNKIGFLTWPVPDMTELLRRIENALPPLDQMAYKSRVERLNWDKIAFDNYCGAECRLMWETISKRVRRYRIMRELIDEAKVWIMKPWTNFYRGSRLNRHPDLPRRPLSTYMLFYLKKKDKILAENPGLEMTDLSKLIAEMYKKISPKTKQKYQDIADLQRKEYDEKMEEFYRLHPEMISKSAAHNVDDNTPQKPQTPFKLYCHEKLKRLDEEKEKYDRASVIEKCKAQWKVMSDKKKVFWINWAAEKENKFHEELKKYMSENPDYTPEAKLTKNLLTKEERIIKERMAGKPEKPPNSAYSLFSRLMLGSKEIQTINPKQRMLVIAQQWKNCSEAEKKEYTERVKHMLEQYKLQYAEYLESLPEDKRQEELLSSQPKRRTTTSKVKEPKETEKKRTKKTTRAPKKKVQKTENSKSTPKKNDNLYEGEPEPPPATPYLMFVKTYQSSYPDRNDAQEVWENMTEEQKNFHRRVLYDLKKVYIESYENFLKGLTPEELKEYSEWKKTVKLAAQDSEETSDESGSDSENECSSDSDSDKETKTKGLKREVKDDDSSSSE